jgi:hypothetical protein
MYLGRRKGLDNTIWQAQAFERKSPMQNGLKVQSYFLSAEACTAFAEYSVREFQPAHTRRSAATAAAAASAAKVAGVGDGTPGGADPHSATQTSRRQAIASLSGTICILFPPPPLLFTAVDIRFSLHFASAFALVWLKGYLSLELLSNDLVFLPRILYVARSDMCLNDFNLYFTDFGSSNSAHRCCGHNR